MCVLVAAASGGRWMRVVHAADATVAPAAQQMQAEIKQLKRQKNEQVDQFHGSDAGQSAQIGQTNLRKAAAAVDPALSKMEAQMAQMQAEIKQLKQQNDELKGDVTRAVRDAVSDLYAHVAALVERHGNRLAEDATRHVDEHVDQLIDQRARDIVGGMLGNGAAGRRPRLLEEDQGSCGLDFHVRQSDANWTAIFSNDAAGGGGKGVQIRGGSTQCHPAHANRNDPGYTDDFRGWYDVQGCGFCHDYCRWISYCGSGGDPKIKVVHNCTDGDTNEIVTALWACRLAGGAHTGDPPPWGDSHSSTWKWDKCAGEGAPSPITAYPALQVADASGENVVFEVQQNGALSAGGGENAVFEVQQNGHVGIGTSAPGVSLEVARSLTGPTGAFSAWPEVRITSTTNTNYDIGDIHGRLSFYAEDADGNDFPGVTAAIGAVTTRGNAIWQPDTGLSFSTTYLTDNNNSPLTTRMTITGAGDVGIGTTTPVMILQRTFLD